MTPTNTIFVKSGDYVTVTAYITNYHDGYYNGQPFSYPDIYSSWVVEGMTAQPQSNTGWTADFEALEDGPGKVVFTVETPLVQVSRRWDCQQTQKVEKALSILKVDLDVDSDNSGTIDDADDTVEASKEFLFWLNNNNDFGYVWGYDCDDDVIGGAKDLQDLAPFKITLFKDAYPIGSKVFLEMEGGPAVVRVFKHRGTGTQHLSDSAIANSMASDSDYQTGTVGGGDGIELNLSDFANAVPTWFVLEGKTAGAGKLCVVVRQPDGTELCRDDTLLNLHDVDDLWSEINLRNCTGPAPAAAGPIYSSWASGIASDDVTWNISDGKWGRVNNSVVLSIHGYNNTVEEGRDYNRTVFKRLYWRGYRSGLAAVLWTGDEGTAPHFNCNVFNSFQAGSALGTILPSIKAFAGSRQLSIMTHSLGNNVASEAVRDNSVGVVKDYVMCEAATGQGAYLSGVMTPGGENPKLLTQARTFGYRQAAGGLDFDELWVNRWSANPDLHPGNANDWWPPPPSTIVGQPSFVDYQLRWGDCYVNPDPQRGYFASVPGKLDGTLYCGYSAADDVVGDTTSFNAWMDNQIGFLLIGPFRPDSGADDGDWDFDDMFDEDLPEQIDATVTPAVISSKMRRWAEMSYYFCDLTMAAGAVGIGNGAKYQSDDSELRGIDGHGAMRSNPLHNVWEFWGWVEGILGP